MRFLTDGLAAQKLQKKTKMRAQAANATLKKLHATFSNGAALKFHVAAGVYLKIKHFFFFINHIFFG